MKTRITDLGNNITTLTYILNIFQILYIEIIDRHMQTNMQQFIIIWPFTKNHYHYFIRSLKKRNSSPSSFASYFAHSVRHSICTYIYSINRSKHVYQLD